MRGLWIFLVAGLLALPVQAQDRVPGSLAEVQLSFAPIVREAGPAVVNIYARRVVRSQSPFADDPFFSQLFQVEPRERVQNSLGSGVIVSSDGIVVSNNHVVGNADEIRVVLSDRREYSGRVLLSDPETDLAIIQLNDARDLPALEFANSDRAEVGDLVLAIGNPFGIGQTVSSGIVSGLARSGGEMDRGRGYFIQTDAPINPGNSGGALVDMQGRLLGINTSILTRSGGSNGIGFAIPANLVAQYVAQAQAGATELEQPWAGVVVQTVDATLAEALGIDPPQGIIINDMHPDSPFRHAGLQVGDVIIAMGGLPVDTAQELNFRMKTLGVGAITDVTIVRRGRERVRALELVAAPEPPAPPAPPLPAEPDPSAGTITGTDTPFDRLEVAPITDRLRARLGLPRDLSGVLVTDAPGRRGQFREGDIFLSLNGSATPDVPSLMRAIRDGGNSWRVEYLRNGRRSVLFLRSF